MNPKPIEQAKDPDLPASLVALRRAAQRAREVAIRTGTRLVVARNGEWVRIKPDGDEDPKA
jgi:hypothetical protein